MHSNAVAAGAALSLFLFSSSAHSQSPGQKTWCNPIDIDYKYSVEETKKGISYRSGADPVIVSSRQGYFLFVTNSGG